MSGILLGSLIYICVKGQFFLEILRLPFLILAESIGSGATIIMFCLMLGSLVYIMTAAGGTVAYGRWAVKAIHSKVGAQLATAFLGAIIFIDDYFSCIATGTVMKPVTDLNKISREKLAFIVDATGAAMCVIIPISSWAAVIVSAMEESDIVKNGMVQFVKTIPYNLYGVLTIIMVITLSVTGIDYGPMAEAEKRAQHKVEAPETEDRRLSQVEESVIKQEKDLATVKISTKGRVFDLLVPLILLIVLAFIFMIYNGGGFEGKSKPIADVFGDGDSAVSLCMACGVCLIVCMLMYIPRKIMTFVDVLEGVKEGMKMMIPTMIILCLAWGIGAVAKEYLKTGVWIGDVIQKSNFPSKILPFIVFIFSAILAFSIGSAWGTFGILIPIMNGICERVCPELHTICLAAVLSGSIFGDHCSPISDTTVMSSTSSDCVHMQHVATQLPYALTTACSCSFGFLIGGLADGVLYVTLPVGLVCQAFFITLFYQMYKRGYFKKMNCCKHKSKLSEKTNNNEGNSNTSNVDQNEIPPQRSLPVIKNDNTLNEKLNENVANNPEIVV